MPRKASNQWSFGELFAAKELRQVLSVSQLTTQVRQVLENQLGSVWVGGEVTNLRMQSSGHAYFTLKDPSAQLSCVLFRNVTFTGRSLLDNGALVIAHGELTVYELRGQYQLVVRELEFQGAGALQVAFEKLKRELDANGYFDGGRKRPLPRFPERIGLVTSPTGAAIRDVLHVIRRRQPGLEIILAPCRVQGDGAGAEIAEAIDELNLWSQKRPEGGGLDLILVTRGGGSLEDLWAFNERVVAEAIYRSTLPIVSAVGHEIDFTISDFVADLRAATPSVAAEIITEGVHASRITILDARRSMARASRTRINASLELYQSLRKRLGRCRPIRLLHERMQVVDETRARIGRLAKSRFAADWQWNAGTLARLLRIKPLGQVTQWRLAMCEAIDALRRSVSLRGREMRVHMQAVSDRLRLLSPEQTLARGYSITTDATGRVVRGIDQVKTGDLLSTQVTDGLLKSKVTKSQACLTH